MQGYAENLQTIADSYLLPNSAQGMAGLAQGYINAGMTLEEAKAAYKATAAQQAAGMFPGFAEQINQGFDTKTLISPYESLAEKTLGVSPSTINWSSPMWQQALMIPDAKTGRPQVATLSQFSTKLMQDPAFGYQYTDEAKNAAGSLTASLLKLFGKVPNETLSTSMTGPTPDLAAT